MASKKPCDQPCASCPWLRTSQTPDAVAASPTDGRGVHWFSLQNLTRQWRAITSIGAMLPCHKTDENAPFYGGAFTKKQEARICVGLTVLARREVMAFMNEGQDYKRYRALPGRRMTAVALAAWASRLYFAGATFGLGQRIFRMPTVTADDDRVGVPWKDSVHG